MREAGFRLLSRQGLLLRERIYDGNAAKELVRRILEVYIPQFLKLEAEIKRQYGCLLGLTG